MTITRERFRDLKTELEEYEFQISTERELITSDIATRNRIEKEMKESPWELDPDSGQVVYKSSYTPKTAPTSEDESFVRSFNRLATLANYNAREKGFYKEQDAILQWGTLTGDQKHWLISSSQQAAICRMHSELSEAVESLRKDDPPDDHLPQYGGIEAELADTVIRILDMAAEYKLKVADAILDKMLYNSQRPHKHGKNS